jgi:hypothetical protein
MERIAAGYESATPNLQPAISYLTKPISKKSVMQNSLKLEDIEVLNFFNKHVEHLQDSLLIREGKEKKIGYTLEWTRDDLSGPFTLKRDIRNHSRPAIESAVLNLRFFMQDNEPTSLRNMEPLYERQPIDDSFKQDFKTLRKMWHDFCSGYALTLGDDNVTKGDILEIMVFGEYAHHNRQKILRLQKWLSHDVDRDLVNSQFQMMLHSLISILGGMKDLNQRVLSRYTATEAQQ